MRTIITCFGIVLLLMSCNQETENTDQSENQKIEQDNAPNSTFELSADYEKTLNQINTDYQKNLDSGVQMLRTTKEYNYMTDSLMTLVYTALLAKTAEADKNSLIAEQGKWLATRKEKFDTEYAKGEAIQKETGVFPEIEEMVAYGAAADLNYERANLLYKKLTNNQ